jgi:hypothetical protein
VKRLRGEHVAGAAALLLAAVAAVTLLTRGVDEQSPASSRSSRVPDGKLNGDRMNHVRNAAQA